MHNMLYIYIYDVLSPGSRAGAAPRRPGSRPGRRGTPRVGTESYIHIYIYMYVCMCIYIYIYIYIYTCVYIYIYIYIAHQRSTPQKSSWTSSGVFRWIFTGVFVLFFDSASLPFKYKLWLLRRRRHSPESLKCLTRNPYSWHRPGLNPGPSWIFTGAFQRIVISWHLPMNFHDELSDEFSR